MTTTKERRICGKQPHPFKGRCTVYEHSREESCHIPEPEPIKGTLGCPFCGDQPVAQPWHGGPPTKVAIFCDGEDCDARPMVSGDTLEEALERWNRRDG